MADFTTDELTGAPASIGAGDIFRVGEEIQDRDETLKKREEASTSLYHRTFIQQAIKNNTIKKVFDWANDKSMQFEPQEGYAIDDDSTINDLKLRGLPMKYFGAVRETTSTREKDHVLWQAQQEVKLDERINNTLGDTGRTTASVVGAIADVDVIVGFGVGAMYSKSASIAKIMAYEGVAEAGLAATHYAMDDRYTMEDAGTDMLIGMMAATGATFLARSLDNSSTAFKPTNNDMQTYKWTTEDPLAPAAARDVGVAPKVDDVEDVVAPIQREPIETLDPETIQKYIGGKGEEQAAASVKLDEALKKVEGDYEGTAIRGMLDTEGTLAKMEVGDNYTTRGVTSIAKDKKTAETFVNRGWDKGAKGEKIYVNFESFVNKPVNLGEGNKLGFTSVLDPKGGKYSFLEDEAVLPSGRKFEVVKKEKIGDEIHFTVREVGSPSVKKPVDVNKVTDGDLNFQRRQELDEQFKAPEFETYSTNRRAFFKLQDNIEASVLERKVGGVKQSISKLGDEIDELKIKADNATTPAWKTKYTQQLEAKRTQLKETQGKLDADLKKKPLDTESIRTMRMVDEMAKDMTNIKDELYELIKQGTKEDVAELQDVITALNKSNPEEMKEINRLFKSKMGNKEFDDVAKNLKLSDSTKKKLLAVALVTGATSASASESESISQEIVGTFLALIVLGLFGGKIFQQFKNPNIRGKFTAAKGRMENAMHKAQLEMSPQASTLKKMSRVVLDSAHTRFTSTVAPYVKAGGKAEEIMTKLVYSAKNGGGAEVSKAMWAHSTMFRYSKAEKTAFRAWRAEQGISRTTNFFSDWDAIHRFREEVTDSMELRRGATSRVINSDAIKQLVKENDEIMAEVWSRPKEYDVFGFEKLEYKAGMIPRMWKSANLNNILNNVSDTDMEAIRDAVADAIAKTSGDPETALELADRYVNGWKKGFDSDMNAAKVDDVFGNISGLLKDDVEFKDFADAMNVSKDKNARARYRIDFDINDLEPVTVNIDGVNVTLGKSDFVERDYKSILDRTANSLYGAAAIGKEGYSSAAALTKQIDQLASPTMRNELKQVRDLVLGVPIPSNNKFMHEISMITKDLTMVAKLPFVVFSMPPELIATLGNAGFVKGAKAVTDSVKSTFGADSAMMDSLVDVSGLATGVTRMDISGYRGLTDDITNLDDAGVVSKIREGTMKMRDFSMLANGLSYFSDVLQRANLSLNAEKFANFVNEGADGAKGINRSRLRGLGIDDATIAMFSDTFTMNSKGRLASIDYSGWSLKKKDKFGEILRNMNQAVSPETTIGETGLYTRTTDLGRALSSLITYPMQQFNIHGVEDLKHMDRMAYLHSVGGFAGAYIGLQSRYAVQNKEMDNDKVIMYALMNMPQLGALSSMSSMIAPATLSTVNDAVNVIGMDTHK